jgi:hypothetical protein
MFLGEEISYMRGKRETSVGGVLRRRRAGWERALPPVKVVSWAIIFTFCPF